MCVLFQKLIAMVGYRIEKLFVSIYIIYTQGLDAAVLDEATVKWRIRKATVHWPYKGLALSLHRLMFIICCPTK